jgi:hypothetical protein
MKQREKKIREIKKKLLLSMYIFHDFVQRKVCHVTQWILISCLV